MNMYPFPFDRFTPPADGIRATCPACGRADAVSVDARDTDDVKAVCAFGCSHADIMTAAGYRGNAPYYLAKKKEEANQEPTEQIVQELTRADALIALSDLKIPSFDIFAREAKYIGNGRLPESYKHISIDAMADALGYSITPDRMHWYKRPDMQTTKELMQKTIAPHPFIVSGLLPAGLCIFSAPSKMGKSWLALQLCNAVATGALFWGRETTRGDVLYLDLEEAEGQLKGRMLKQGVQGSQSFFHQHEAPHMGEGLLEYLEEWRAGVPTPRLIVIDVAQRVKPVTKGRCNAYEGDYLLYPPLNEFAIRNGLAIVAITHNRKATAALSDDYEAITGSVAQMAAAAATWLITGRRGQSEEKRLKATGRYIRDIDEVICFDPDTCTWQSMGSEEDHEARAFADNPVRVTLWALIGEGGGSWFGTFKDLWEEIAERTGKYPYNTDKELATGMRKLYPLLLEKDDIRHEKDKNKSGYHKFYIPWKGRA